MFSCPSVFYDSLKLQMENCLSSEEGTHIPEWRKVLFPNNVEKNVTYGETVELQEDRLYEVSVKKMQIN